MALFHVSEARVNIGVVIVADGVVAKGHGVLMVRTKDENNENVLHHVDVVFDKPQLLYNGLNYFTYRRLKKQIVKMGLDASHLELSCSKVPSCYALDTYRQIYGGPRQGDAPAAPKVLK